MEETNQEPRTDPKGAEGNEGEIEEAKGKSEYRYPGFLDAHTHLLHFSKNFLSADLSKCRSKEETLEKAKDFLSDQKDLPEHLLAVNFDESHWCEPYYPEKEELDTVSTELPVIFVRVCGHMAVANSLALNNGIAKLREEQETGSLHQKEMIEILGFVDMVRGHLREKAVSAILKNFKTPKGLKTVAFRKAIRHFSSLGITGIHDVFTLEGLAFYEHYLTRELCGLLDFPLEVKGYLIAALPGEGFVKEEAAAIWDNGLCHTAVIRASMAEKGMEDQFRLAGIKLFMDGSLGARTAALLQDYSDAPGEQGSVLLSMEQLQESFHFCREREIELMLHVIGDRALEEILVVLEALEPSQEEPLKLRLEHVELFSDEQLERLRALHGNRVSLTLSMMPNFAGNWSQLPGGMNLGRLGIERYTCCERFRAARDSKIPLVFGSDCMPPSPSYGIVSAAFHPYTPERLTPSEALECYMSDLQSEENYVLLSSELESISSEEDGKEVKVLATVFRGKEIYRT